MKIYVGHSKDMDYQNELYAVIRSSPLNKIHEFFLPHENSEMGTNSKEKIKTYDLMIAETSYNAMGLGIEMGWADAFNVPLEAIQKTGTKIKGSTQLTVRSITMYSNKDELINALETIIKKYEK